MELVSIIIPIHNAEQTIDRCLNSIVRQTYENLEIILVENGSADNSWAECMKWKEKDSRIICLQSPKGVSYARNSGLNAFRGGVHPICRLR